ncbi:hypothetical protein RIF25_00005, partial [Thermosynechococcaceae cyanobacterium BACA0444]
LFYPLLLLCQLVMKNAVSRVNKPNFQTMSHKELCNWFLPHRNDQDAFYAYVDRLHKEGNWIEMRPVESIQDLENHLRFMGRFQHHAKS